MKKLLLILSSLILVVTVTLSIVHFTKDGEQTDDSVAETEEIVYTLSDDEITIERGQAHQLYITPMATEKIAWTTSDETVAMVKNGEVVGNTVGTATITATIGEEEYVCNVTVVDVRVTSATIALTRYVATLPVGSKESFEAELVVNGDIRTEKVTWTVEGLEDDVISTDDYAINGNTIELSYNNVGTVLITATYGETKAVYVVYVKPLNTFSLAVPENLKVQGEMICWDAVEYATAYGVRINDLEERIVEETSFVDTALIREYGSYKINVRAIADPTSIYEDSAYSKGFTVNQLYLSFYKYTSTADNNDYVTFTAVNGDVDTYYLCVDGQEQQEVQPNNSIAIANYGESKLRIVAKMSDGTVENSREISFIDESKTTLIGQYGGNGVAPTMDRTDVPTGSTSTAIKLNVHTSADSSYSLSLKNPAFINLPVGTLISYRIYVTNITTNLYKNRNDWENGKQTATSVPLTRIVRYRGTSGYSVAIPGANGVIQENTWYTAYARTNAAVSESKIDFSTYVANWQSSTERHYAYTLWIDSISIGGTGDSELFTTSGAQSLDARPFSSTLDVTETFNSTASIKIVTGAGSYGESSGYVSNVAFAKAEAGDYISYYIKVGEALRATSPSGDYTTTTLKVSELVNPGGFGQKPLVMKKADGTMFTGDTATTGEWYQVVYRLTGKEEDTANTAFKRIKFNSGRLAWMRSGSQTNAINATFYVDGIVIGTHEEMGLNNIDVNFLTTWNSQYGGNNVTPQIVTGADLPTGCQSEAALKLNVFPSSDSSYDISIYNNEFVTEIKAGATLTYRIYVTDITTNLYKNRNDWENGKQTATSVPLNRLADFGKPNSHTSVITGNPSAIQQNTWYTVTETITEDITDGKLQFSTFLASWQSNTERHYAYTLYIELISIDQP